VTVRERLPEASATETLKRYEPGESRNRPRYPPATLASLRVRVRRAVRQLRRPERRVTHTFMRLVVRALTDRTTPRLSLALTRTVQTRLRHRRAATPARGGVASRRAWGTVAGAGTDGGAGAV